MLALFSLSCFIYFRKKARRNTNIFIVIPFCLVLLMGSAFVMLKFNYGTKARLADTAATMAVTVISEPSVHGDYNSYIFKGRHPATGQTVKFSAIADFGDIDIGDKLNLTVRFSEQDGTFRNDRLSNGIFLESDISQIHSITEGSDPIYTFFGNLRLYIKNVIFSNAKDDPAGVMTALATGERDHISDQLYADTKTTGVTHFLVVSGLHLSIISAAVLLASKKLHLKKKIAVFISFAAICLMTVICNFHSSAVRSAFMSLLTLIAPLINRKAHSLNSLGFAVTVMIILNPFLAGNAAFLLSVSATFGVIYLSPALLWLTEYIFFKDKPSKLIYGAISIFIVSFSALVCVLPITIHYYGYVSLLSPLVTVLISTAVEVALVLTLIGVVFSLLPIISATTPPLIFISTFICKYIIYIITLFAKAEILVLTVDPKYTPLCFIFSAVFVASMRYIYHKKLKERKDEIASYGKDSEKLA